MKNEAFILGFAAYSGTGKTTLLEQLIPLFNEKGLNVSLIKHAHHDFDIDYPGKDSYRLRKAGAIETLVASNQRWALVHEHDHEADKFPAEPNLTELITHLTTDNIDLVLVEGFKHEAIPRIELHRKILNKPYLYPNDAQIIALATDSNDENIQALPLLDINDPRQIMHFIIREIQQHD